MYVRFAEEWSRIRDGWMIERRRNNFAGERQLGFTNRKHLVKYSWRFFFFQYPSNLHLTALFRESFLFMYLPLLSSAKRFLQTTSLLWTNIDKRLYVPAYSFTSASTSFHVVHWLHRNRSRPPLPSVRHHSYLDLVNQTFSALNYNPRLKIYQKTVIERLL